jgi:hypothetical protein
MKALVLAALLASATVASGADVDMTLKAEIIRGDTVSIDVTLVNHTHRDLCFFPSLDNPKLFDKDGKDLEVFQPGPEVAPWQVLDNVHYVAKDDRGFFEYWIGPEQELATNAKPTDIAKATLEVVLFDCVRFHELQIDRHFLNPRLKRFTVTATMDFRDAETLPRPPPAANDDAFRVELEADPTPAGPLQVRLKVSNSLDRNICFVPDARFLRWQDGPLGASQTGVPDAPPENKDLRVAWDDGFTATFPISDAFLDREHARRVWKLSYALDAYDCIDLLSSRYYQPRVLFTRVVSWGPGAVKQPAPSPP